MYHESVRYQPPIAASQVGNYEAFANSQLITIGSVLTVQFSAFFDRLSKAGIADETI